MKSRNDGKSVESRQAANANAPAAGKRFRIEKLEERIAPKKAGGGDVQLGRTSSGMSFASTGGLY